MKPRGGVAPSIIAADYGRFEEQLRCVEAYAVRWHVDVMDGHYVPNLTIGPDFVRTIARTSQLPQDVHLMITNPDESWEWYAKAGASRIAFHPDTTPDPRELARRIRAAGVGAGIAVNPEMPVREVAPLLEDLDHVVVMSVRPGFAGQAFLPEALGKLREVSRHLHEAGLDAEVIVDGGVNARTAPQCVESGAELLVAASAIFGAPDPPRAARELRDIAEAAR